MVASRQLRISKMADRRTAGLQRKRAEVEEVGLRARHSLRAERLLLLLSVDIVDGWMFFRYSGKGNGRKSVTSNECLVGLAQI